MKMHEILESATAGATSAGSIAAAPDVTRGKVKKAKRGTLFANKKNPDGTVKNALDMNDNVMGGKPVKR